MVEHTKTAGQILEELRKERDELNGLIQALEKRLGITSSLQTSEPDAPQAPARIAVGVDTLPIGFFHNLSQAAAAEKLLALNPNHPLTTPEILEAFRSSGMDVHPKTALTILYTALKRSPRFERVGSKAWGLREWYPEKKRRKDQDDDSTGEE